MKWVAYYEVERWEIRGEREKRNRLMDYFSKVAGLTFDSKCGLLWSPLVTILSVVGFFSSRSF